MTPKSLKTWRKSQGLKQADLADLLGIKKRIIQYYEKGERDGKPLQIPQAVALACYAISKRVIDFDGEKVTKTKKSDATKEKPKAKPKPKSGSTG